MSLSTAAKDYIANHFGSGTPKCFVSSGISYTDPKGISQTGSTQDVVATLKMNIGGVARGPGGEVYIDIPDWSSITDPDVTWIGNSQSGAAQYCVGVVGCTPGARRCRDSNTVEQCRADGSGWDVVQTCGTGFTCVNGSCVASAPPTTETTVGPFEFEFGEVCTGNPTASIDVSGLKMWQETDTFRMNNFMVTNTSDCIAYFATQLKFWRLETTIPATCPSTAPEWSGMDRSTWTPGDPYLEIATIAPGETKEIWMDFFVPATTRGRKVLCMYLWANFSKWDLYDELAAIGES